jgi:hypothetical protein
MVALEKVLHLCNVFASTIFVSINGLQTHAAYNCESAVSSMSLHFCTTLSTNQNNFLLVSSSESPPVVTFTILISSGFFTSMTTMHISKDQVENVIFGQDWFDYCSTNVPFEPGMSLCFRTLP